MNYLLLALMALFLTGQNIVKKKYRQISSSGVCFFSAMTVSFAILVFAACNRNWHIEVRFVLPAVAFAFFYAMATVGFLAAIRHGSLANSSLVIAYSLLIPTFYGLIFLKESIDAKLIAGLVLIAVSLWLTNYQSGGGRITWKWVVFISMGFVGNGMCTTVQKISTNTYGQENMDLIMVMSLLFAVVLLLVSSFVLKEKELVSVSLKKGWHLALACGVMNGVTNMLVIYMNDRLPASVMFPVLSGGNLIMIFLYSLLVLRERFTKRQYIGYFLGLASVIMLNL